VAQEDSDRAVCTLIIDTDILIWYLRRNGPAADFVDGVPIAERNLSAISYLELLYGCRKLEELNQVRRVVADLFAEIVPLTEVITGSARQLMERFILSRHPDVSDVLIAATALNRGEVLATGNHKHFHFVPGLEIKVFTV
jgi:predicted nucleic acid-binding protein